MVDTILVILFIMMLWWYGIQWIVLKFNATGFHMNLLKHGSSITKAYKRAMEFAFVWTSTLFIIFIFFR